MKLANHTVEYLAELICGASGGSRFYWPEFPYRSRYELEKFFSRCGFEYEGDDFEGDRHTWTMSVLNDLKQGTASVSGLPSDSIGIVIKELMANTHFIKGEVKLDRAAALNSLNEVLKPSHLQAFFDNNDDCLLRSKTSLANNKMIQKLSRPMSKKELDRRARIESFLSTSSEDDIIEKLLVPLFRELGYLRVEETGHRDRSLEFGKDLWMKFRLPTGHYIYFTAQVKKGKIDSAGKSKNTNVTEVLNQARMALDYPIFDPEVNRQCLIDHLYIISAGLITKQARHFIIKNLDASSRRHIIFMDRVELMDLGAVSGIEYFDVEAPAFEDDIPF